MRSRIRSGRGQALARAAGLPRKPGSAVLDATGGLGRDAFTLAALGAHVTLFERSPLVAELLRDAQRRVRACSEPTMVAAADRLRIVGGDARDLPASEGPFDCAYLDPMYDDPARRALPQKEMQLLRELVGADADAAELLTYLRSRVPRVVVKRGPRTPALGDAAADECIRSSQARFDLYFNTGLRGP